MTEREFQLRYGPLPHSPSPQLLRMATEADDMQRRCKARYNAYVRMLMGEKSVRA